MNYSAGVTYMKSLASTTGSFSPYSGIVINYPGYKKTGDYRLTVAGGTAPTHANISHELYNLITTGTFTYAELTNLLIDIYKNGTNTTYRNSQLEYLKNLIYWITLQEEINYPRSKGYAGINLAFCRFFEAIYSTQPGCTFTITDVENRCNNNGKTRPVLYTISTAPSFYHY